MTVRELIEALSKEDPDAIVCINDSTYDTEVVELRVIRRGRTQPHGVVAALHFIEPKDFGLHPSYVDAIKLDEI